MKHYLKILILLAFFIFGCNKQDDLVKRETVSMGTIMEYQVAGVSKEIANKAITEAIKEVEKLNQKYSTYKTDNYIFRINNINKDTIHVDNETYKLMLICDEAYKATNGNFDAAIGNLIDLIGFEKNNPHIPDSVAIANAVKKTGWKNIKFISDSIIYKPNGIKISFNAMLPGYAADVAKKVFEKYGIKEYLINTGGEIFGAGRNWTVGIQHPRKKDMLLGTLVINGKGVATSGDYERFFKANGKQFSHIIDPLTGYPIDRCEAVTIIANNAAIADYLSTGVFVAGPEKGLEIIEKIKDVEGIIVDTNGKIIMSSGFKKYLRSE